MANLTIEERIGLLETQEQRILNKIHKLKDEFGFLQDKRTQKIEELAELQKKFDKKVTAFEIEKREFDKKIGELERIKKELEFREKTITERLDNCKKLEKENTEKFNNQMKNLDVREKELRQREQFTDSIFQSLDELKRQVRK